MFGGALTTGAPRDPGAGKAGKRCEPAGTTHVPRAVQTTTGSASRSAADSETSGRAVMTLRASNSMARDVVPTRVMRARASM